jgi:hypothetical protein
LTDYWSDIFVQPFKGKIEVLLKNEENVATEWLFFLPIFDVATVNTSPRRFLMTRRAKLSALSTPVEAKYVYRS